MASSLFLILRHFQKDHPICMCLSRGFLSPLCFSYCTYIFVYLFVIVVFICFAFFTDQVLHYFMLHIIFSHRTYCDCGPRISTVKFHIAWGWMIFLFLKKKSCHILFILFVSVFIIIIHFFHFFIFLYGPLHVI